MGIQVQIIAGKDERSSEIKVTGSVQHIITNEERHTFKINDSQLKTAILRYFGKSPKDAFLRDPTHPTIPTNLYAHYGWDQVSTVLIPERFEILGITSEPVIVKTQTFKNHSSQSAKFNVGISDSVTNTTSSSWSTGGTLSVSQSFEYGVKFLGTGGSGTTTMSYEQSWGVGGQKSQSVTVGSTAGVEVELGPGQTVVSELTASRGVMTVRIQYKAYLTGYATANYNPRYKGHHYWAFPVRRVMDAGQIVNAVNSTEEIKIGYYSDATITVRDEKAKSAILSLDCEACPGPYTED